MKTFNVAAYVQDGSYTPQQRASMYKEYTVKADNESKAEDKADKLYHDEMGFAADTVEVI